MYAKVSIKELERLPVGPQGYLLLADGTSFLLLTDGASLLVLMTTTVPPVASAEVTIREIAAIE